MPESDADMTESAICRAGFLLVPDFAMMAYAAASEPLRAANRISGRALYRWRHFSPDGGPVMASSGVPIVPEGRVGDSAALDILFVFAGGDPAGFDHPPTLAWLRALARRGVVLAGISAGPWILAKAGLLAGRRATIHWEHLPAFVEEFPDVETTGTVFETDGDIMTCAGGVAALDMMMEWIGRDHGHDLATAVGDWFLRQELRGGAAAQRMSPSDRFGVSDPRLVRVLAHMDADPVAEHRRAALARLAGLSVRRLEALFADQLGTTIGRHALGLRLDRARRLLTQSTLSVIEVATDCGFASASHFSRAYRARFGLPPRAERGRAERLRGGPAGPMMARGDS